MSAIGYDSSGFSVIICTWSNCRLEGSERLARLGLSNLSISADGVISNR